MLKQDFRIDVGKEDRVIRGEVRAPEDAGLAPVVIICHGFKAFKEWGFFPTIAATLAEAGFVAITFNFSMNGVGEDPETFSELEKFAHLTYSREQEDLALVFQHVQNGELPLADHMDRTVIGLLGHSRGGGNSLIFALEHPEIQSVVIWNSINRPHVFGPEVICELQEKGRSSIYNGRTKQHMPIDREVLDDIEENKERYYFIDRLHNLKQPLLVVQADQDHPGFFEGAQEIARRAPQAHLKVIQDANHTFRAVHPFAGIPPQLAEALSESTQFFKQTLNRSR